MAAGESWLLLQATDLVIHMLPVKDQVTHELDETCVCGPRVEHVPRPGGSGWVLVHPSLDGRECVEPDRKRS